MTIHLVMENGASFRSTAELWEWLFACSSGMLVESAALDMHAYIIQCNANTEIAAFAPPQKTVGA